MGYGTNITLIQLLDTFQNISLNHNMINDFFVGNDDELTANKRNYPLLWVDVGLVGLYEAYKEFTFRMYVMDIEQKDTSNRYEIQSDATQIFNDIYVACRDIYDLRVKWGKPIVPFDRYGNDYCSGCYIDMIITAPSTYGVFDIPVKQVVVKSDLIDSDGSYFNDTGSNDLASFNYQ
jgi:hypothetical protein